MTVTYTASVATASRGGCFLKLLKRWRGSIYKLVWFDLIIYLAFYYGLNCLYRFILDEKRKKIFKNIVLYCNEFSDVIPLGFILGFYISVVMVRWWNQYMTLPFPDSLAVFVSATLHGQDDRGKVMRRTVMRYVCLCLTMTFALISPKVKKRFPTLDHFVDAGLLEPSEKHSFSSLNETCPNYSKHWLPIVWAASIITRARKEGKIRNDYASKTILDELNELGGNCGLLLNQDSVNIPLVYTQVVNLAVYGYLVIILLGDQWVEGTYKFDLYFPVFTLLQFFFYTGWLKGAISLINPFGDDDDDFEVNWMIDRNLQISYLIVDEMYQSHPKLLKDQFWDEVLPMELPGVPSTGRKDSVPLPSTVKVLPDVESDLIAPPTPKVDKVCNDPLESVMEQDDIELSKPEEEAL